MKGSSHQARVYILLCPLPSLLQHLLFFLCCVSWHGTAHSLPTTIVTQFVFQRDGGGLFWCKLLSKGNIFSGDCFLSNFIGNWGALLLLADIRRLGLHPAILSCTCSQMSLARWLVVDVALILCNLDITVYKTTQDFGVLWNEITYSTDFLFFLSTVYEISIEMAVLICSSSPCWLRPASCSWIQQMFRLSRPMEALWTLFSSSPPRSKC